MFGKIQGYAHHAVGIMKGGLAHAQRAYSKGLHLAGELSSVWDAAKQVGRIAARYGEAKFGAQLSPMLEEGVHWGDALKGQVIKRHGDVIHEIEDLGHMQQQIAAAVRQPHVGAYTGY